MDLKRRRGQHKTCSGPAKDEIHILGNGVSDGNFWNDGRGRHFDLRKEV
jgi:hypothetical protein